MLVATFNIVIPFNPGVGFLGFTGSYFYEITIIPVPATLLFLFLRRA